MYKTHAFMAAVQSRQSQVYRLLHGVSTKQVIATRVGSPKNTMLHMAGLLAPSDQLSKIPGPALQMQRELQWFKEVETITLPRHKWYKNTQGLTPRELFTQKHEPLLNAGEKWMKDTASSCSLVGSLVATIMFAVAFSVPGGNNQDTGYPIFLSKKLFKIFIISDAISLFSSTAYVLMFLGILTSRYAEDDFLKSLPTKLIIGLFTLFLSLATMTIAFCAALLIMLHKETGFVITLFFLASLPVTLFGWMQFPPLIQILKSTYLGGPSIFSPKVQRWL
ncbi:ankyrin repeat-containing protein NPR4-like [Humulus lupulus]|uniref:ankyrin repeat-containing protein NPR4-like n=1 Tax=Humulus lupulus TaxID=3486 RepID=UPI002B408D83|nr:ankyrin repeat-containing protein NPR4-like [Humulus lupulus]XP_062082977.1 ankyrin repeat-containing protein NPR4-like [Humulus lupulus]